MNPLILTDIELYHLCQKYGGNARLWTRKFAGLLPEVFRRKLYKRRGYASIYEFAKKLAGMSENKVDKILHLSEKLKDKPKLRELFETGMQGWSKLQSVVYIATPATDSEWAEKVERLPQRALEAYVQETRNNRLEFTRTGDGENKNSISQGFKKISFPINNMNEKQLRILKQQFEKERRETLSWNEVVTEIFKRLQERDELKQAMNGKIVKKEIKIQQICANCLKQEADKKENEKNMTRHIPTVAEKFIQMRSGGICEFPGCNRPGEIRHHTRRYALLKNHDPQFIRFLCKAHEGLLQAGLIENEEKSPAMWKILGEPNRNDLKFFIDERVEEFRRETAASLG